MDSKKPGFFLATTLLTAIMVSTINLNANCQQGCTDPLANNYSASATVNNGSCTYNTTFYTPPVKVDPLNSLIPESSGLQWAGGSLWTFNDSQGDPAIYRIDTTSNAILQTVMLDGATNIDWEDIAFDGTNFYVGDFGNNQSGDRTNLKIYKFALSDIPPFATNPNFTLPATKISVINFTYNDQVPVTAVALADNKFDCEALIVDNGKIHLFTKNWKFNSTSHYLIDGLGPGTFVANKLDTLATNFLVTGASKVDGKNLVILLGYEQTGLGNHFMELLYDYSGGLYFNGNKRQINLPNALTMGQAEGITFRTDSYGYISNEKVNASGFNISAKLRAFNVANLVPPTLLATELIKFDVENLSGTHKISWSFSTPVEEAILQYSTDGTRFLTLKSFGQATSNSWMYSPALPAVYYRLAYRNRQTAYEYSKVVAVKNEAKSSISLVKLSRTGVLTFEIKGSSNEYVSFKIITTDGRLIANSSPGYYTTGVNTVLLGNNILVGDMFYISYKFQNKQTTKLIKVAD